MKRRVSLALLAALLAAPACKDSNAPGDGDSPSNIVFPARDVSYSVHVQPLFNQACNFGGCHDGGIHQSPLKLTDYGAAMFSTPGVIVAGNPEGSTLVLRIEGRGAWMPPPPSNHLSQNQTNGVRTWIVEGAKNN